MFRALTNDEARIFRQWARDNYKLGTTIDEAWHPVVRDECMLMNEESQENV